MNERRLTHEAHGHDTSSDADVDLGLLELLAGALREFGDDLRDGMRDNVFVRVSRLPEGFDLLEFVAAKVVDFFVECQVSAFLSGKLTIIKQWSGPGGQCQKMQ